MIAFNQVPGLKRSFGFENWKNFDSALLEKIKSEYRLVDIFDNRFCILTPINKEDKSTESIQSFFSLNGNTFI